jgi:SNF2 family DNA or RNA helicase
VRKNRQSCGLFKLMMSPRLNLAMANRVFIVEPQWNPSVENQAVARALRLGQKQAVLVTRYVVEYTVEQVR